ncbi:hypothetical protein [Pseudomonas alabamensis]|uniref:hypothetical protein n=1 Tax=Pseudomonas alabamensis TaxID=3064349 RepID=UPI003F652D53
MTKIAVKHLTKSDLTLFTWQFKKGNAGNQKAINLNANIFIDKLYPGLPSLANQLGTSQFLVDLAIYGPGQAGKHSLARKIVKGAAYKNWRLNGEFINNPIEMPDRYNCMTEGDFAILEFGGDPSPNELKIILVCAQIADDVSLHAKLSEVMGGRSMIALSPSELAETLADVAIDDSHAARITDIERALEDAAQGGIDGQRRLAAWTSKRQITKDQLNRAKDRANAIGLAGEEFVDYFLSQKIANGQIKNYEWSSRTNAIAAFDFIVDDLILIDAKSTSGDFKQKLHISLNELLHMREHPYHIYRVYDIRERQAKLRICENLSDLAKQTLPMLEALPFNISVDSISLNPDSLIFGEEILVDMFTLESENI